MANWSRAVYHMKLPGVHQFTVSATRRQNHVSVNASLSISVLDQVSGLGLTTRQLNAVLHADSDGAFFTDPVLFTARSSLLILYCIIFMYFLVFCGHLLSK